MTGHEQQSRREGRKEPDNVGLFRVDKETSAGWGRLRDDLDFHVNYISMASILPTRNCCQCSWNQCIVKNWDKFNAINPNSIAFVLHSIFLPAWVNELYFPSLTCSESDPSMLTLISILQNIQGFKEEI